MYKNNKKYSSFRIRKKGKKKKTPYMSDAAQTAKIKKLEKQVKANMDIFETKYLDTPAATIPFISNLNGIFKQVTDVKPFDSTVANANINRINQRVGHKVLSSSVTVQGEVYLPIPDDFLTEDRTHCPCRLRMIFLQVKEDLGAALLATDFLDKPIAPMTLVDAFYKRNRTLKLKILKDVTYTLEPDYWDWSEPINNSVVRSSGYTCTRPASIKFNHKLYKYDKNMEWDPDQNDSTPIYGPIQMFLVADTPNAVDILWHSRHVFRDQ